MEMEREEEKKPTAMFIAFGTKGDVLPIAAIAAAFSSDQKQYHVVFVTHLAHENLGVHLAAMNVAYLPVSSQPVLSPFGDKDNAGFVADFILCLQSYNNLTIMFHIQGKRFSVQTSEYEPSKTLGPVCSRTLFSVFCYWKQFGNSSSLVTSFSLHKRIITREHRRECFSIVERIFGYGPSLEGDFIAINFFALEGWCLAELFHVRCVVAAPYVVPYSAPASFERHFRKELPSLYEYLQEAPIGKVCWNDVIHWMWPLFTEDWGLWRSDDLNLSPWPFTDPVTGLPLWHDRPPSPLLLYGFSKDVVECPGYWPSNVHVCGFWFLPTEWQFSCSKCVEMAALISLRHQNTTNDLCSAHAELKSFLKTPMTKPPVFVGLSSIGSMGFLRNPQAFLQVLQSVLESTSYRFILFSAGYDPLNDAVRAIFPEVSSSLDPKQFSEDGCTLFSGRMFFFSGAIPYNWLFPRCVAAVHHGGSGSTAAALRAGIPQVVCPFLLDQFYWAERMFWLGVASKPLKRNELLPDKNDYSSISEAASALSGAIDYALSPQVKACAAKLAEKISLEDGVLEAVKILKEELSCPNSDE